jgi:adenylate cyclase
VVKGKAAMLGGERRDVTLLFSDLRNFTRFSEHTRPEHVVKMLNTHFDAMVRIIAEHQGFVVDFLGDSLFAVFGAPDSTPDHAWNAVSCAIDMQLERQRMNEDLAETDIPPLEMGIGINSGPCVVGNMGSRMRIKYGVVGHAVNLASRLESFTVGGQVLISESTFDAVRERLDVAGPLEVHAKGVESPIRLWEVRGILNDKNKRLSSTASELSRLAPALPVRFRLVTDKRIASLLHEGRLIRLSSTGAELETELTLEVFTCLQILFPGPEGKDALLEGRIVGTGDLQRSYIIRFSVIDDAAEEALDFQLNLE